MNITDNVYKFVSKLPTAFADVFYPQRCIMCNSPVNIGSTYSLCTACRGELSKYGKVVRDNDKYFEEAVCALEYSDHVKSAMTDYKFQNIRYLHRTFAHAMYQKVHSRDFINDISLICPVPIHPMRDREYNQSELMARCLSELLGIEFCHDLLIKIKNITPLSKMGYRLRKHQIKSAVTFNIQYNIVGKTICLIDDIYTTGATANECSRILRMYGAKKVYVLSACYAADKKQGGDENAYTDITP